MNAPRFAPAVIACVDIGSPKRGNVGWALLHGETHVTGRDLPAFIELLEPHIRSGRTIAIGFECPLYVPKRADVATMTARRIGEEGLNWCGGPGASVLATGLVQTNWVLTRMAELAANTTGTTRWHEMQEGRCQFYFWEAFITSRAGVIVPIDIVENVSPHERDALAGALAFSQVVVTGRQFPSDLKDEDALSLIGMQLLETGLSKDVGLISESCAVLKVRKPQ